MAPVPSWPTRDQTAPTAGKDPEGIQTSPVPHSQTVTLSVNLCSCSPTHCDNLSRQETPGKGSDRLVVPSKESGHGVLSILGLL